MTKKYLFLIIVLLGLMACKTTPPPQKTPVILSASQINNAFYARQENEAVRVIAVGDTVRMILLVDKFFPVSSAQLKYDPDVRLDRVAKMLKDYNVPMKVAGYTDDIESVHHSEELSLKQAEAIIAYLWQRGVNFRQFRPIGHGKAERDTIASNRYVSGSALNRRIEITFNTQPLNGAEKKSFNQNNLDADLLQNNLTQRREIACNRCPE